MYVCVFTGKCACGVFVPLALDWPTHKYSHLGSKWGRCHGWQLAHKVVEALWSTPLPLCYIHRTAPPHRTDYSLIRTQAPQTLFTGSLCTASSTVWGEQQDRGWRWKCHPATGSKCHPCSTANGMCTKRTSTLAVIPVWRYPHGHALQASSTRRPYAPAALPPWCDSAW